MSKLQRLASTLIFLPLTCSIALLDTTTAMAQSASPLVISEFRFRGYFGPNDEYIELYNNTDSDIVVSAADGSSVWTVALFANGKTYDAFEGREKCLDQQRKLRIYCIEQNQPKPIQNEQQRELVLLHGEV